MAKKQKIWFAVFLAMFLIPEILWPQSTIILYSWVREILFGISPKPGDFSNFDIFSFSQMPKLSGFIFLIKLIGLLGSLFYSVLFYKEYKKLIILIVAIVFALLLLATLFYAFFIFGFNPQIG